MRANWTWLLALRILPLTKLKHVSFRIVTVTDRSSLKLPLTFRVIKRAAKAYGRRSTMRDALNEEHKLNGSVFSTDGGRRDNYRVCNAFRNLQHDQLERTGFKLNVVTVSVALTHACNVLIKRRDALRLLGINDCTS